MTATRRILAAAAIVVGLIALAWVPVADAAGDRQNDGWQVAGSWARKPEAAVRLIAAGSRDEAGRVRLGLQFRMEPGWKIYWRSPGEAGLPPSVDWGGSENLADFTIRWPAPHRATVFGIVTYAYENEVVLPIDALRPDPAAPARVVAAVDYQVCKDICIPYREQLALDLPPGGGVVAATGMTLPEGSAPRALLDHFERQIPATVAAVADAPLAPLRAELVDDGKEPGLRVIARATPPFQAPDLFVEAQGAEAAAVTFGEPEVRLLDGGQRALFQVPIEGAGDVSSLLGARLTVTVVDDRQGDGWARAAERTVQVVPGSAAGIGDSSLLAILAVALLGGLILNLMPCVLPVLSLKILGLIEHTELPRRDARLSFLATALGIVTSFLVLATAATAFKAAGVAVGWGIQFQQPAFLVFMILLVMLFAANQFGAFEIGGFSISGPIGEDTPAGQRNLFSAFVNGAFATLLATPCSAPFVGTALGFALSQGALQIIATFAALGVGMALPYLLIAALPGLASLLPRPGRWMNWVRYVLGALLAGTALWLASVLSAQTGWLMALAVVALAAVAGALPALRGKLGARGAWAVSVIVAVSAAVLPFVVRHDSGRLSSGETADSHWQPFDRGRIADLGCRRQGGVCRCYRRLVCDLHRQQDHRARPRAGTRCAGRARHGGHACRLDRARSRDHRLSGGFRALWHPVQRCLRARRPRWRAIARAAYPRCGSLCPGAGAGASASRVDDGIVDRSVATGHKGG